MIIAAYNAEAFLARALELTLAQSGPKMEVIVVDDGSTDKTFELASRLAETDDRLRPVKLATNSGPAGARNAGIDIARGDWICIVDADDAMLDGRLARLVDLGHRERLDIVADNFWFWDHHSQAKTEVAFEPSSCSKIVGIHEYLANAQASFASTDWGLLQPMFRREFLNAENLRYPTRWRHGEDFLLMVDCLLEGAKFGVSCYPGYLYTVRTSGNSRTQLNYQGIAHQCGQLILDPRVKMDRRLVRLLRGRAAGARCLAANQRCYQMLNQHEYRKIMRDLCWNVNLWRALRRSSSLRRELLCVVPRKLIKTYRSVLTSQNG